MVSGSASLSSSSSASRETEIWRYAGEFAVTESGSTSWKSRSRLGYLLFVNAAAAASWEVERARLLTREA